MRPSEALTTLGKMGLTLKPRQDGKLIVTPVGLITPEARALIVEHRDSLLAVLSAAYAETPPSASPANPRSIAARLSAYHERLAICAEAGDIPEAGAHRTAAAEAGGTLDVLAGLQAADWRRQIAAMVTPNDARLARVQADLIDIAAQLWLTEAATLGWSDEDLFGCASPDPFAPGADLVRGLAVQLVTLPWHWTSESGRKHRCRVVRLDAGCANFETSTGRRFTSERFTAALDHAVPIWTAFSPPTRH